MPRESQTKPAAGSGGLATTIAVILFVACAGLAVAFFQRGSRAGAEAESAFKIQQNLSNEVDQLRTKLALERSTSAMNHSNQQQLLIRRASELLVTSNGLWQAHLSLSNAHHEAAAIRADFQTHSAATATLEAQRDQLLRRLELLPALQRELERTKQELARSLRENETQSQTLGSLQVEMAELKRKLDDPAFLRLQARKAEDNAAARKRIASTGRIDPSDPRLRLELQPDGSVRAVSPTNNPAPETE